uniref:Sulfotransferase domain-containing protein n=1 Tax=Branchiostoma floridae TaxID=7739 RepID=C3XU98_BRAFL|eukprot:XP_002612463.1 hypothetical protein BRAFLDRAFT_75421 [Branchiostoma floridae]
MASCSNNYQHRGRYTSCLAGSLRLSLAVLLVCRFHTVLSLREGTTQFKTHPMLYFGSEDVEDLRGKAKTTHKHIADVIAQVAPEIHARPKTYLPSRDYDVFASRWNEIYGNNLAALAIYCVLFPEDRQALDTALDYMDRMASLKQWQVKASMKDEVPVAHSLTGFATAYDFLYEHFDDQRRKTYIRKISDVTKELYDLSKVRGWGKQYLQNHVATNYLALLTGSLVLEVHDPKAVVWKERAISKIEETMFVLNHVVDGSLDEGVAYGSYTSRSITQYVYLALRHFNISHLENFWLKEHFWFYYSTMLPGYQRTIGIADSNNNWFYGPESQLVFLDRYVLRNGSGNWLARLIRKHRPTEGAFSASTSQRWCTLHTEFIWYNPSLGESPPQGHGQAQLHTFTDWGVVTYGSALPVGADNTFLSFKSGSLHGRAVWNIVHRKLYPEMVTVGWQNFNPGHEHPDQNSFVFAPAGQLFVTEALYGPKLTHLNNVLVFSPSKTSQCYQPWEGQLGECAKWLAWKETLVGDSSAEVITADQKGDMVHISGEAAHAYHPSMGLKSVYRNLLLLNKELLLVVDHIEVTPESRLKQSAAFFHNVDKIFQTYKFHHYRGAKVETPVGDLRMFWVSDGGDTPWPMLETEQYPAEYQRRITHYVNITMSLSRPTTRMAYVLMGPNLKMEEFKFVASERDGVQMMLKANGSAYHVSMATRHQDPVARATYLGFPGYAHVVKDGRKRLDDFPNAQAVMHLGSGSWTLKMQWMYSVLKSQSRIIHVIRDPRAWVHAMTAKDSLMYKEKRILEQVTSMFQNDNKCGLETGYAFEFEKLRLAMVDVKLQPHKLLAHVWAANMAAVLRLKQALPTQNYRLLKFENIVSDPLGSTESLHRFMGVPVPPATVHRMVQATRVQMYSLPFEEGLTLDSLNLWKRTMPTEHLQDIEEICGPIMRELGYITIMT